MEHYLENLYEIIEEIDGEDTDWNEEFDEDGDEKWGNDFSEL